MEAASTTIAPQSAVVPVSRVEVVNIIQEQASSKCLAEYIWIGGGSDLKSRTVVLDAKPSCAEELPIAEIDGSSFGLASEEQCEIYLQPRKVFPDPFRGGDHILVLCDTATMPLPPLPADGDSSSAASLEACWDAMQPHASNHRAACEGVMAQAADQQPLFSMQQEYSLYSNTCVSSGQAFFGGSALCGSGGLGSCMPGAAPVPIAGLPTGLSSKASARLGRDVSEAHMAACLAAGISFAGHEQGSGSHQWAFKMGPCGGVDAADQLCVSRFLLGRVAEHAGAEVVYDSSTGGGGQGARAAASAQHNKCVISFSTAMSRDPHSGLAGVSVMMERLRTSHAAFSASPAAQFSGAVAHAAHRHSPPAAKGGSGSSWHSALDAFGVVAPSTPAAGGGHHQPASSPSSGGSGSGWCGAAPITHPQCAISVPTSTLINGCGAILDRRPPASADPYLATMLLTACACGLGLPLPQASALQLAAAMAAATAAAAAGCGSVPRVTSPAIPIAGAAAAPRYCSLRSGGSSGLLGASSSLGYSFGADSLLGADSLDSHEALLSALDRLDGYGCGGASPRGVKRGHVSDDECDDDECDDDGSSPAITSRGHCAAAADQRTACAW